MKEQLLFILAITVTGWIIAKCSDALLRHDMQKMIDNDYEQQWEKEIMTKEEEAKRKADQKERIIWLMNQRP